MWHPAAGTGRRSFPVGLQGTLGSNPRHHLRFPTTCFAHGRTARIQPCAPAPPGSVPLRGPRLPPAARCGHCRLLPAPPTRLPIGRDADSALRPRLLSGSFDHASEGSSGAGANPRRCCQGCTAGGKAWVDGVPLARTGQLGVPGVQGTQAGSGPRCPPPAPVPRASPRRRHHLLPAVGGPASPSGLTPFRFWIAPSAWDGKLATGNWQNWLTDTGQLARTSFSI